MLPPGEYLVVRSGNLARATKLYEGGTWKEGGYLISDPRELGWEAHSIPALLAQVARLTGPVTHSEACSILSVGSINDTQAAMQAVIAARAKGSQPAPADSTPPQAT